MNGSGYCYVFKMHKSFRVPSTVYFVDVPCFFQQSVYCSRTHALRIAVSFDDCLFGRNNEKRGARSRDSKTSAKLIRAKLHLSATGNFYDSPTFSSRAGRTERCGERWEV